MLDSLLGAVRRGESRSLVLHGDPGVGKSAMLDYLAEQASDCRLVRVTAVQSEMELAFAALQQLCASMLDQLVLLPEPLGDALRTTFGLSDGPAPDRFLVGLAVLSLFAEVAAEKPLVCVVDDEQWLDGASAQILAFVARRLGVESVAVVFGARVPSDELSGLPRLGIEGLKADEARALLERVLPGPVDAQVRDEIIAETRGNPLALLELPRGFSVEELAGGFGMPGAVALAGSVEESFRRRIEVLPADTRRLLLVAAAEPLGDPGLVWRAAAWLGVDPAAAHPAVDGDLAEFGKRVRFRHPLVRSAAYHSASAHERQEVHRALAEVTDPGIDPDRRAWHRARAAIGPDEDVAAELVSSAGRAQARGGLAAAAAFLEQASVLTPGPAQRAQRALDAAQAKFQAGALNAALELLAVAEAGPLGELERARADLVRARVAFVASRGNDAPPLLLKAATRLEPVDARLARATYLEALTAAQFAGRLAGPGGSLLDVARAASTMPSDTSTAADILLEGLVANFDQGYSAGLPILRRAVAGFGGGMPVGDLGAWIGLAVAAALHIWDDSGYAAVGDRWAKLCREAGALSDLPAALHTLAFVLILGGDLTGAASLVEEVQVATEATEINFGAYGALGVIAFRGDEVDAATLIEANIKDALLRGEGARLSAAEWANAVLNNGLGRYQDALAAAQRASENTWELMFTNWALAELIEAAARTGMSEAAADAHLRLSEFARASNTDWVLGIYARANALLSQGDEAEAFYRDAIEHLGRTRIRAELARAHLLYGEWLRRQRRRGDARAQLRTAQDMLEAMGMEAFAERARRELRATGERARKRDVSTQRELTQQETQVAKLARDGLSNPEIGGRLYISARTVEYHLSKVFEKLAITKRNQLGRVLT